MDTLTSNQPGATYQWYGCGINGFVLITNATNQAYVATSNGQYAVSVSLGNCIDTSACVLFYSVGLAENSSSNSFTIFPNPFTFTTTINFSESQKNTTIKITDVLGKELKTIHFSGKDCVIEKGGMQEGVYFVEVMNTAGREVRRKMVVQ